MAVEATKKKMRSLRARVSQQEKQVCYGLLYSVLIVSMFSNGIKCDGRLHTAVFYLHFTLMSFSPF